MVDQVSAAVIWPYPLDEQQNTRSKNNTQAQIVASKVTSRFSVGDDELTLIEQYLGDKNGIARSETATDLFLASLDKFNLKRQKYIKGIQKFTHQQKNLAHRLSSLLEQRDSLVDEQAPVGELNDEISMAEQVFRNRESILTDLCEQPVRVEENLGVVARTIAQYVE